MLRKDSFIFLIYLLSFVLIQSCADSSSFHSKKNSKRHTTDNSYTKKQKTNDSAERLNNKDPQDSDVHKKINNTTHPPSDGETREPLPENTRLEPYIPPTEAVEALPDRATNLIIGATDDSNISSAFDNDRLVYFKWMGPTEEVDRYEANLFEDSGCEGEPIILETRDLASNFTFEFDGLKSFFVVSVLGNQKSQPSSCSSDILIDTIAPTTPINFNYEKTLINQFDKSPDMKWTSSDGTGSDISTYEIAVGSSKGQTDKLKWTQIGDITTWIQDGLSLKYGETLYSSIRAKDQAGNLSETSEGQGFIVTPQQLVAQVPSSSSYFGKSLAQANGIMVIGGSGSVEVYQKVGAQWIYHSTLKGDNTNISDGFGRSVDTDGNTIVVGAPFEDSAIAGINKDGSNNASDSSGAAYVFVREGENWVQQAYIKSANPSNDDWFGHEVAVEGNTLVVGAPQEDGSAQTINGTYNDNAPNSGATYIFTRSNSTWSQQAYL